MAPQTGKLLSASDFLLGQPITQPPRPTSTATPAKSFLETPAAPTKEPALTSAAAFLGAHPASVTGMDDTPKETEIGTALKRGFEESTLGMFGRLLRKYPRGEEKFMFASSPEFKPDTVGEYILKFAGEMVPDLPLYIIGGGLASSTLRAVGGGAFKRAFAKGAVKKVLQRRGLMEATKVLAEKTGFRAIRDGLTFAIPKLAESPIKQQLEDGTIDATEIAKDTAMAFATGAAVGIITPMITFTGKEIVKGVTWPVRKVIDKGLKNLYGTMRHVGITEAETLEETLGKCEDYALVDAVLGLRQAGKKLSPSLIKTETAKHFQKYVKQVGIPLGQRAKIWLDSWVNTTVFFNRSQSETGLPYYEFLGDLFTATNKASPLKHALKVQFVSPLKTLYKTGYTPSDVFRMLHYVEQNPQTKQIFWNPAGLHIKRKISISPFQGKKPTPDVLNALFKIRERLTSIVKDDPQLVRRVGFLPRYVPYYDRIGPAAVATERSGARRTLSTSFNKKRVVGQITSTTETDINKIIQRYTNEAGNLSAYGNILDRYTHLRWQAATLGRQLDVDMLDDTVRHVLHLKKGVSVSEYLAERTVSHLDMDVARFITEMQIPPGIARDTLFLFRNLMYKSLIGMNPRSLIKQYFQPDLVAACEIGIKNVNLGKYLAKTPQFRKFFNDPEIRAALRSKRLDYADLGPLGTQKSKVFKIADFVLGAPGEPGMLLFDHWDWRNRKVVFAGAYHQIKNLIKKGKFDDCVAGMTTGEQAAMRRALKTGGHETFAKVGGIIRARRANYLYSIVDYPQALKGDLRSIVPFTEWSRAQLSRVIEDVQGGHSKQLARRLVYPLMQLYMFEQLTGYRLPRAYPPASALGLAGAGILPIIAEPIEKLTTSGAGAAVKSTGRMIPATKAAFATPLHLAQPDDRFKEIKKKDVLEGGLRLEKIDQNIDESEIINVLKSVWKNLRGA